MNVTRLRHCLCVMLCVISINGFSQVGIQQAEYFWDNDPGTGNAFAVPAPNGGWDLWLTNFILSNANNPTTGSHTLGVRVKDGQGLWGPAFKKIVNFGAVRNIKVTAAEYFINNDPGTGNATALVAFDGNYNAALETVFSANPILPEILDTYSFGIRIKDEFGSWGPVFKKTIAIKNELRNTKITAAEFYWDNDPGQGNGSSILVFNESFDSALATIFSSNINTTLSNDKHTFNLRVCDENGVWGPSFKKVISSGQSIRNIKVTAGEYFWDNDPGQGSGTTVLAYDGFYNDAIESIRFSSSAGFPASGVHVFNIRFRDESNVWGPVFKKIISRQQVMRNLRISAGEYFLDNDPGQGNANVLIAFDGNYNDALEIATASISSLLQMSGNDHIFGVRFRDETLTWGPVFKRAMRIGSQSRSIQITQAEYYWGPTDPGQGSAFPLIAFDGQLNSSIESVFGTTNNLPETGVNIFNIRIKDGSDIWGPIYKRSVNLAEPKKLYINSEGDKTSICLGDSLLLKAHGGSGYIWSPTESIIRNDNNQIWVKPTTSTQYKIKGLKNGLWDSAYFSITVNNNPVLQVNNPVVSLGSNAIINVYGADSYSWNPEVILNNPSGSSVNVVPPQTTTYTVSGTNSLTGCKSTAQSLVTITSPNYLSGLYPTNQNLQAGEFFWDTDPGIGNGWALQTIDGSWNQWLEIASTTDLHVPTDENLHTFQIRLKDRNGNWGNVYKTAVRVTSQNTRSFKVTFAEYFWNTDPGENSGIPLIVFDGNYNAAIETIWNDDTILQNIPTSTGMCLLNIRVKDEKGLWGPIYKRVVAKESLARGFKITSAEYFWDNDPGVGNGIAMLAFDGNFSDAFETVSKRITALPSGSGAHLFCIRTRDENGLWGSVYKKTIVSVQQVRNIKIISAEYFWDNDPGISQANPLLAFDGNFNQAIEDIWVNEAAVLNDTGKHCLNIRVKDENGNWGPLYKRVLMVGFDVRQLIITAAEYFWDTDPGEGNGTPLIVFDGEFNDAFEGVFNDYLSMPTSFMDHIFNVRIKDETGKWGPVFKRTFRAGMPTRDIKITSAEYFFGNSDPGEGSGNSIVAYDGSFDKTFETLFASNIFNNQNGIVNFNIRVKDEIGQWGPIFKKTINIGSPIPTSNISVSGSLVFCQGDSVVLSTNSDSGYTFQWYKDSIAIPSARSNIYAARSSGYYYVVTSFSGFSNVSQINRVQVNALPTASFTAAGPTSFCTGGSVNLISLPINDATYQWQLNGYNITGAVNSNYNVSAPGVYNLKVMKNGCTSLAQPLLVKIGVPISANINASGPTTFCEGRNLTLTAPVNSDYTYKWFKNDTLIIGETNPNLMVADSGRYFSEISNNGCPSNTNSIIVTVNSNPVITISSSGSPTICQGTSLTLNANQTSGLTWLPSGLTTPSISVNASGSYYAIFINANGCVDTSNTIVVNVINNTIIPVITTNSPVVNGSNLQLNVTPIQGATYNWSGPNNFLSSSISPVINNIQTIGSGIYSVFASISGCQTSTATTSVNVLSGSLSNVTGYINTPLGDSVSFVKIRLNGTSNSDTISGFNGTFRANGYFGGNYTLTPSKNNDINKSNGVSTLDIIKIQSHILHVDTLNSPYKIIAADVNSSGTITNLDILLIRRLILGIDTSFPGNKLWSFVDKYYSFPNPYNPFPYPSTKSYNPFSTQTNQNFIGIKLGDVTLNWNKNILRVEDINPIQLQIDTVDATDSDSVHLVFKVKKFQNITGFQFTLKWNSDEMKFFDVTRNSMNIQFGQSAVNKGYITALWNDELNRGKTIADGDVLFELSFLKSGNWLSKKAIDISSTITPIEAYDADINYHNIVLTGGYVKNIESAVNAITANDVRVYPNPVVDQLVIDINSTLNQKIQIELLNDEGKLINLNSYQLYKGSNILRLYPKKENKLIPGIYILRIKSNEYELPFKLLIM